MYGVANIARSLYKLLYVVDLFYSLNVKWNNKMLTKLHISSSMQYHVLTFILNILDNIVCGSQYILCHLLKLLVKTVSQ